MRVLICGGRDYTDAARLNAELDAIHHATRITMLIHGGARGADSLAEAWANSRRVSEDIFGADWNKHGKSAGFVRNAQMLRNGRPELVIAFPGGKGTAHMVCLATETGVPVKRISNP